MNRAVGAGENLMFTIPGALPQAGMELGLWPAIPDALGSCASATINLAAIAYSSIRKLVFV